MMLAIVVAFVTLLVMVAGAVAMFIERLKAEVARQVVDLRRAQTDITAAKVEVQALAEAEHMQTELREAERTFQEELAKLVEAAAAGDFSRRVDVAGKTGLKAKLGEGMNRWAETVNVALTDVVQIMSAFSLGDMDKQLDGNYQGVLLQLQTYSNRMGDQISGMADRIAMATVAVQRAMTEITSGVSDLSERTEHQAIAIEETAASMEELTATVRQNAGNAQEANKLAIAARLSAAAGSEIALKAVDAIDKVEASSRQITEIVALIQEIALQTNLLALNAAVEAARAGDAGRGFAVVATEVRALAQRAAQASKDIKRLIASSETQVKDGVGLVKQAGKALRQIVTSVVKVADFVSEIAAASQEQAAGIDQVSKTVTSMDEATQQNAALVEKTNAALHSALSQVDELRKAVAFFKTGAQPKTAGPCALKFAAPSRNNPAHRQQGMLVR